MTSQSPRAGPPASPRPAAVRRAGERYGYGAASVLPPLDEEARGRPRPPPPPGEHPDGEGAPAPGPAPAVVPRRIGKYLVSPLIKVLENGWFVGSVSIRSGFGSTTTDRILRLARLFRCPLEAASFAFAEGLRWIGATRRLPAA